MPEKKQTHSKSALYKWSLLLSRLLYLSEFLRQQQQQQQLVFLWNFKYRRTHYKNFAFFNNCILLIENKNKKQKNANWKRKKKKKGKNQNNMIR